MLINIIYHVGDVFKHALTEDLLSPCVDEDVDKDVQKAGILELIRNVEDLNAWPMKISSNRLKNNLHEYKLYEPIVGKLFYLINNISFIIISIVMVYLKKFLNV